MRAFLNRIVVQPPQSGEIEPLDKPFFDAEDGITGYTLFVVHSQDQFAAENYEVHLLQDLPDGRRQLIVYPLFHLDRFAPFLDTIFKEEGQYLLYGKKFEGIGKQLLVENEGITYHIENNGNSITKLYATNGDTTEIIEINNINSFIKLIEDVDQHADKYLEKLAKECDRNIKKEQGVINEQAKK